MQVTRNVNVAGPRGRAYIKTPCCKRTVILDFTAGEDSAVRACKTCGTTYTVTTDGEKATFQNVEGD